MRLDRDEVSRALDIYLDPEGLHAVQSLPSGRWETIRLDQADRLDVVESLADGAGLYVSLNPIEDKSYDGRKGFNNKDIVKRRWFFLDVDPIKPKEHSKSMATDAEKAAAYEVFVACLGDLDGHGFPYPLMVDSGNGFHGLWRIDLPDDKPSGEVLSRLLKRLGRDHDNGAATVDPVNVDAKRIARLPGTWVRKGDHSPERPHRQSKILHAPAEMPVVSLELLKSAAGMADPIPQNGFTTFDPWSMTVPSVTGNAYARSAMERELGKVATCGLRRNGQLYESALKLGGYVANKHLDEQEVIDRLTAAARACGLGQDGDPNEIARAIRNGLEKGKDNPKDPPPPDAKPGSVPPERLVVGLSEIRPAAVEWLWHGRIARKFISLWAGRTGIGKSFVVCDIAARLSRGDALPGSTMSYPPCRTLFISEDPPEVMLSPRLYELGADPTMVKFMTYRAMAAFSLADTDMLDRAWQESGSPDLVVIDPPSNFIRGKVDSHKDSDLRAVLMRVVEWADSRSTAIVFLCHLNKGAGKGAEAVYRVMGGVAWMSTARVALAFAEDSGEPGRCLVATLKSNLGPMAPSLGYQIVSTANLARVEWLGEVSTTANEAIEPSRKREPKREVSASDFLIARFRESLSWSSEELFSRAKGEGISRSAVFEAKELLDLPKARKFGASWTWWVPPNWPHLAVGEGEKRDS